MGCGGCLPVEVASKGQVVPVWIDSASFFRGGELPRYAGSRFPRITLNKSSVRTAQPSGISSKAAKQPARDLGARPTQT